MSSNINPSNIRLEPCDVFWGKRSIRTVETVADSSGSLNDTYFELDAFDSSYSSKYFYVWFNVASGGTDPALSGKTGIEVAISTDDSASTVATALGVAIEAVAEFRTASVSSDTVTITNEYFGESSDITDGASSTGFTFATTTSGYGGGLGATNGGIEVAFEVGAVDVMADQTGEQMIDRIMNANNINVSMTLEEITQSQWSLLVGNVSGDKTTPAAGTEVVGIGESKRFRNMTNYAGELILVPVGASDNSRNHYFWLATPIPESINFSGADLQQMPIAFNCFRDTSKDNKVNIWAFGDGTQDLSA